MKVAKVLHILSYAAGGEIQNTTEAGLQNMKKIILFLLFGVSCPHSPPLSLLLSSPVFIPSYVFILATMVLSNKLNSTSRICYINLLLIKKKIKKYIWAREKENLSRKKEEECRILTNYGSSAEIGGDSNILPFTVLKQTEKLLFPVGKILEDPTGVFELLEKQK